MQPGDIQIDLLRTGNKHSQETLLLIHGYLSSPRDPANYRLLVDAIRQSGWHGHIAALHWDGGDIIDKLQELAKNVAVTLIPVPGPRKVIYAIRTLAGIGSLAGYWKHACHEADLVGKALAGRLISGSHELPGQRLIMAGHSLGCRVIQRALLAAAGTETIIADQVWLLGGAVLPSEDWHKSVQAVRERIVNAYSPADYVLKLLFPVAEFALPIGVQAVHGIHPKWANRNVARYVRSHWHYHGAIARLRRKYL